MNDDAVEAAGMKEVSKDEFYAAVGQLNVHPRPEREVTYWEAPNRALLGISYPGYLCEGPKRYFTKRS